MKLKSQCPSRKFHWKKSHIHYFSFQERLPFFPLPPPCCSAWHAGSQFPNQESNLCPLQWKLEVLTTGSPGKSQTISFTLLLLYLFLNILYFKIYIYVFIWLYPVFVVARGIQFPDDGSNLGPLHWQHDVLATGPPGRSLFYTF